ncbi:MAG: carboxypeptidase regulatory-like domain-containing protein, partial [Anaerolineae bacterium]
MKLSQYPRPKGDNGWGIHWSPSTVHPTGDALSPWIDELLRMHIKWVKVLDDGDGSSVELCRRLVRYDIMPIVRIYRPQPNPGRLSHREEEAIRRLVDVGVVYFETNNEPDVPAEWQHERLPPDWMSIVADQFIHDADRVLALGGLPGLPALSVGSKANLIELVVRKGRADIFARGAWIAVHNYTLNHPLEYPDDPVHQKGAPLTRQEYERYGEWAWDGQPRQLINIWRRQGKRPGSTIEGDSDCWRCFELADLMAREALGYSVPVIGTEGGAVIGWRDDRRYPRVTPEIHKEWTVQINQFMHTRAPAYFFTTCHWLLANFRLGHHVMGWESQAGFSDWWESAFGIRDHLPAVDALRQMSGGERPFVTADAEIMGQAAGPQAQPAQNLPIRLIADGQEIASVRTNARGRFRFSDLPAGRYELQAEKNLTLLMQLQVEYAERAEVDLTRPHGRQSAVRGRLLSPTGEPCAGVEVRLRAGGEDERLSTTDAAGQFHFDDLPAGTYTLRAGGGFIEGIYLDGWTIWEGELILPPPPRPRFVVASRRLLGREETAGRHLFFGRVWDENGEPLDGITVEMGWEHSAPGTQFPTTITGTDPRQGAGWYEFVNTPGTFFLRVRSSDAESEVADGLETAEVPGRRGEPISYEVHFQRVYVPAPANRSIVRVDWGNVRRPPAVTLQQEDSQVVLQPSRQEGTRYLFEGLPAGTYTVRVEGLGQIGSVRVDGWNPGLLHFPMGSLVRVRIGQHTFAGILRLEGRRWGKLRQSRAEPGEEVCFTDLPADTYHLRFQGWQSPAFTLDGENSVFFQDVEGQLPHASELTGRLLNAEGEPLAGRRVRLLAGGEVRGEQYTDRFGRYRFAGLGPDTYALAVEELGLSQGDIVLDGQQSREIELTAPAAVRPKLLGHYVLLPAKSQPGPWVSVLLLSEFIRRSSAVVGFSLKEAQAARYVTIAADADEIDESAERRLLDAGCIVRRLPGESHALSTA